MLSMHRPILAALALALICAFVFTGCNTAQGLGRDVERAGEEIQESAR